jgi:serine/threonine protein kinase/class 3 adenylate cyclase
METGPPTRDLDKTVAADPPAGRGAADATDATVPFGQAQLDAHVRSAGPEPPLVAGYEIVRLLGQGGMGVVWEANDHRLGRTVALKVHADAQAGGSDALWIEARLAAKIAHPGIVPIHEVGFTMSGQPYYTMDLVEGTSLRALLREGPLPPLKAMAIARAVAEAIGAAHARGIVHCDLKPGNVVIDADGRARVLDFGLAFAMSGLAGQAFGPMRGSPPYMSPEQIAGQPLTAATDVYSLGVVLFEMLTGSLPFEGSSVEEMLAAASLREAGPPSKKNPAVGRDVDRLVLACLEKQPDRRPADGRALARELRKVMEGDAEPAPEIAPEQASRRPSSRPAPPLAAAPETPGAARTYRFELHLAAPPERLWPLVSNTERFNRAVGLPRVAFSELPSPAGPARKSGQFRVLGMDVAWEEHPFEWVHEHRHSVYRRYTKGPLSWLRNRVSLQRRDDGGTDLVHEVEAEPRGTIGRLAAAWEIQWKLGRRLEAVYKRMDDVARDVAVEADPFEPPHRPSSSQNQRVATGLARLSALPARRFSTAQLERLRDLLLHAPDKRLERMRPYALADAWGESRAEVLDMFLYAANAGLVDILWDLVCPGCYVAHEVAESLRNVAERGSCQACGESYTRDLVGSVELIFRPHREVREIATSVYCTGSPAMRPHVLAQQVLAPHERRSISVRLVRGELLVRVERRPLAAEISSSPAGIAAACDVRVGEGAIAASPAIVRSGDVELRLVNDTDAHQVLRVERPPHKSDSVTAATAMTHPTFQGFFSEELLAEGEHLRVSHMAFLAVDIEDRARVLRDRGDAVAFARFTELADRVAAAAAREQGAVFRAAFDATLAAFSSPAAAVRAAIALAAAERAGGPFQVRVSVHAGRCIAVSRGARIEYFGETIERTVAQLADAPAGSVAVSSAVDDEPAALAAMQAPGVERKVGTSRSGEYAGRRVTQLHFS